MKKIKGSFTFLKWEESEVKNSTSTGSVKYKFSGDNEFIGEASYAFYYSRYCKDNPLESTSTYHGFIVCEIEIDGLLEKIVLEDSGEFRNGEAISTLKVINSPKFQGKGSYRANHTSSEFEIILK